MTTTTSGRQQEPTRPLDRGVSTVPRTNPPRDQVRILHTPAEAFDAFKGSFTRNAKGNLGTNYDGAILSVFARRDGLFAWSIRDFKGVQFSPGGYDDEEDALLGLWEVTAGGFWLA